MYQYKILVRLNGANNCGDYTFLPTSIVGTENTATNSIGAKIYPNPTDETLNIELNDALNTAKLTVYNMNGVVVLEKQSLTLNNINISDLASGFYICEITQATQKTRLKLVKR